ncbi:putative quinol monooxygenase [Trinickia symbiotica]|uniref:putative quinol monooxygenase n=1 Tax=Trinickia symbiotica TaxID=863227 RepID=UPI00039E0534|nr:putative quinol monooxygenase [Trinickia symbiotica]
MLNYTVLVEFRIKPEGLAKFESLAAEAAQVSVANEPGCQRYDILHDRNDPCRVLLYEIYADEEAFNAHLDASHTKSFLAAIKDLVESQKKGQRLVRIGANGKDV